MDKSIFLAIMAATLPGTIVFLWSLFQKHLERSLKRRSSTLVIYNEIKIATNFAINLRSSWDNLEKVASQSQEPLGLIFSSDVVHLRRIPIEDLSFPPELVAKLIIFDNRYGDFEACFERINSGDFAHLPVQRRVRIIRVLKEISDDLASAGSDLEHFFETNFPCDWFTNRPSNIEAGLLARRLQTNQQS